MNLDYKKDMTSTLNTSSRSGLDSMRVDHVMLSVPNYEETVQWYCQKLNAIVEKEWTVEQLPDLKLAYLKVCGFRIEIVGSSRSRSGMPNSETFGEALRTTGIGHICFWVDDVDAAIAELNQRGVQTFIEAADYPNVGVRIAFIKDNNGNIIEFMGSIEELVTPTQQ
ncbi:MAG: VOC family protein [Xenococcaceae cyanobacterium]